MSKYIWTSLIISSTTVMAEPAELTNGIIELLTVNSRLFTLLEDLSFQKAFDSYDRLRIDIKST